LADDPKGKGGTDAVKGLPAPGEFVQVVITPRATSPAGVVVPEEAVQRIDGRNAFFLKAELGKGVEEDEVSWVSLPARPEPRRLPTREQPP